MVGQIGVDPGRVGLEVAAGLRGQLGELLGGDPAPAERTDDRIRSDQVLTEPLGKPATGHVAAEVHLVEAVLCMDVALDPEQVLRRVGVDLRDAVPVTPHLRGRGETGQRDATVVRRQRPADAHDHAGHGADQGDGEQDRHGHR